MQLLAPTSKSLGTPSGTYGNSLTDLMPIGYQDAFGNFPGGGDAVLYGYLTQMWEMMWHGLGYDFHGVLPDVERIGSIRNGNNQGRFPIGGAYVNLELTAVVVEIISYPDNFDMIFGEPPLINAGYCGWGWESNTDHRGADIPIIQETPIEFPEDPESPQFLNGFLTGAIKILQPIGGDNFARTRPENINQNDSVFFPPARNCVDFWWHLKEGVRANIHAYGPGTFYGSVVKSGLFNIAFNPGDGGQCPHVIPTGANAPAGDDLARADLSPCGSGGT